MAPSAGYTPPSGSAPHLPALINYPTLPSMLQSPELVTATPSPTVRRSHMCGQGVLTLGALPACCSNTTAGNRVFRCIHTSWVLPRERAVCRCSRTSQWGFLFVNTAKVFLPLSSLRSVHAVPVGRSTASIHLTTVTNLNKNSSTTRMILDNTAFLPQLHRECSQAGLSTGILCAETHAICLADAASPFLTSLSRLVLQVALKRRLASFEDPGGVKA
ncbi:hypothetical protein V8E53_010937 [Lactarius tabidus]